LLHQASNILRIISVICVSTFCSESALAGYVFQTLDDPNSVPKYGTFVEGISGSNVVGFYGNSNNTRCGFVYNGSTYTTLDDPNGVNGTDESGCISGSNVVGSYTDSNNISHGFLYNGSTYTTIDDPKGVK